MKHLNLHICVYRYVYVNTHLLYIIYTIFKNCLNEFMLFGVVILPTKNQRLANKNPSPLCQESPRDSHNHTGYCHCPCPCHRP